jgi:hypothetical protein
MSYAYARFLPARTNFLGIKPKPGKKTKENMQMKKFFATLGLIALMGLLCSVCFAADYVVTNDDNPSGNSATAFTASSNGTLTQLKKLTTGGTGLGGGYFSWTGVQIAQNEKCLFVANTGSDTISAFQVPSFKETGSYGIPGMFSTYGEGGSIALHPTGKLLVSADSGLFNIATWAVSSNCALKELTTYTPEIGEDYFSPIGISPNGAYVVVPAADYEGVELYSVGSTGALTDKGYISYSSVGNCSSTGCYPTGMDFTSDSKLVIFGNATIDEPSALSASITSSGLTNGAMYNLTNSAGVINVNVPHFTKTARGGSGMLLFGASGYSSDGPSGIICTNFTESPLSISLVSATAFTNEYNYQGSVVTFGSEGYAGEPPASVQAFSISSSCGITAGTVNSDANGYFVMSIAGFPANQ